MARDKAPVKLRERVLKDGTISLFLDTYEMGKHYYEFLQLYIVPERTPIDRERNKVTRMQAEAQRARRIIDRQNGMYGRVANTEFSKFTLCDAIRRKSDTFRNDSKKIYEILLYHVEQFGDVPLQRLSKAYILELIQYIRNSKNRCITKGEERSLKDGTIHLMFASLSASLNKAVRDGLIFMNPCKQMESAEKPKLNKAKMCYLDADELKVLAATDCSNDEVKRAFIFACYTALRISDIKNLTWADVRKTESGYQLEVVQEKTGERVCVPLSKTALQCIGEIPTEPKSKQKRVFKLPLLCNVAKIVRKWAEDAGINKRVTFHTSRHTAATLLLTYGADIYTTSKILGHQSIKTTQIYAEIVNEKKVAAIEALPTID